MEVQSLEYNFNYDLLDATKEGLVAALPGISFIELIGQIGETFRQLTPSSYYQSGNGKDYFIISNQDQIKEAARFYKERSVCSLEALEIETQQLNSRIEQVLLSSLAIYKSKLDELNLQMSTSIKLGLEIDSEIGIRVIGGSKSFSDPLILFQLPALCVNTAEDIKDFQLLCDKIESEKESDKQCILARSVMHIYHNHFLASQVLYVAQAFFCSLLWIGAIVSPLPFVEVFFESSFYSFTIGAVTALVNQFFWRSAREQVDSKVINNHQVNQEIIKAF